MTLRTPMMVSLTLAAAALLAGCSPCPDELVTLDQLVSEYNANAAKVPRLWARAKIKVDLVTKAGLPVSWGSTLDIALPNGHVLLQKHPRFPQGPYYFLMKVKEVDQDVFRAGSHVDDEAVGWGTYFLEVGTGEKKKIWTGRNALAGAPGTEVVPIDPHQLVTVLGICELPTDYTDAPFVVQSMDADAANCAYVLHCVTRQPVTRRLGVRRKVFFHWGPDKDPSLLDRWNAGAPPERKLTKKQRRPFMVQFLNDKGQEIMTAYLQDYKPIEPPAADDEDPYAARAAQLAARSPGLVPTDIRIQWPEKKMSVHIRLSEMTSTRKGNIPKACRPPREEGPNVQRLDDHITIRRPSK